MKKSHRYNLAFKKPGKISLQRTGCNRKGGADRKQAGHNVQGSHKYQGKYGVVADESGMVQPDKGEKQNQVNGLEDKTVIIIGCFFFTRRNPGDPIQPAIDQAIFIK